MSRTTLQEISRTTGIEVSTLKKHAQRGKLKTSRDGTRVMVDDADLEAYLASEEVARTADSVRGKSMDDVADDISSMIARMPQSAKDAILRRMTTERPKAIRDVKLMSVALVSDPLPGQEFKVVKPEPTDAHFGFPVGYQHPDDPKWKRVSETAWRLKGQTYSWNGLFWDPDCVLGGPSNPDPKKRPQA